MMSRSTIVAATLLVLAVGSAATAAVKTEYLGDDVTWLGQTIQGDWVGNVGADGYHLLNWGGNENQKSYPTYLDEAQRVDLSPHQWVGPGDTTEARAVENADETQRCASFWYTGGTGYIHIRANSDTSFILGLYLMDWDSYGPRQGSIAVCDSTEETSPPWEVDIGDHFSGVWMFVNVAASADDTISVRVRNRQGNFGVNMLSFDPAGTRIAQFDVTDQITGSAVYTNLATVDVAMVADPADETTTVTGYMITGTDTEPGVGDAGWLPVAPTQYTIAGGEGTVNLYAWAKDDADAVAGASATIRYSTAAPGISNVVVDASYKSADISWQTDAPALGWIEYGLSGGALDQLSAPTAVGTDHSVTLEGLTIDTAYDYQIHGDGSASAVGTFSTKDAGAFYIAFLTEVPPAAVDLGLYDVSGGITNPTYAGRNDDSNRGVTVQPAGNGFDTPYLSLFSHPTMYGGGDEGYLGVAPPGGVNDPIAGTDANPSGAKLWVFSFQMGANADMPLDSTNWQNQPGVRLFTNRGDDAMEDLLKVRFSESNIVLDHAGGTTILVEGYTSQIAYQIECTFDMEADIFRVTVDGGPIGGDFTPLTGSAAKGVGGIEVRGGSPVQVHWQNLTHYDTLSLSAQPVTNSLEGFVITDTSTGSPTVTNDTTVNLGFDLFGPGYTHHIIEVGDSPTAPADETDGRWTSGAAPATVDLGTPGSGDVVTVTMWILDADNGIQSAAASIVNVAGDPVISNVDATPGIGEATITWDTAIPASGRVLYGTAAGPPYDLAGDYEPAVGTAHSVTITNLVPGSIYHFAVESNEVLSADDTFQHLFSSVSIEDIVKDESSFFQVGISWTTGSDAIGWVEYGPAGGALSESTAYTDYGTAHSVVITVLAPNTQLDFRIHSNASAAPVMSIHSKDAGAFTLAFNQPVGQVETEAYNVAGGMLKPTDANGAGVRQSSVQAPGGGIDTTYLTLFNHPAMFGGDSEGITSITPPGDVSDPLLGTDANPEGKLWVFSFLLSSPYGVYPPTDDWGKQPGIKLFSSRGGDGVLANVLKVRLSENNIVLDHAGGTAVLVETYALDTAYLIECTLDMEADTINVSVDGAGLDLTLGQITPSTTKGVGGFEARGGAWEIPTGETQYHEGNFVKLDDITLKAVATPNEIRNCALSDLTTGSTTSTNDTTVGLSFEVVGPGYVQHIIEVGDFPPGPVDDTDPRWVAGDAPATVDLGVPGDGDTVMVTMWLLDANNAIAEAGTSILYATSDPGISNVVATPGVLGATITWETALLASGRVLYDTDGAPYDNATAFEAGIGTGHSVTLTGLAPGMVYFFAVESNEVISDGHSFAHLTDTPAISNIRVESKFTSLTITWQTNANAIGWVRYGLPGPPVLDTTDYGPYDIMHTAVITGLPPDTGYTFYMHSNGATSPIQLARTRDPGVFTLEFELEETMSVLLEDYSTEGKMIHPTTAEKNGPASRRGTTIYVGPDHGFTTQHVDVYAHNGDYGRVSLEPGSEELEPFVGTDINAGGNDPWTFSFELGAGTSWDDDTTDWADQPGVFLLTNRGGTFEFPGQLENLIVVRFSNYNIVLDYLDSWGVPQQEVLVEAYVVDAAYKIDCALDMEADTFTVRVDDTPVAGTFGLLTGATDKGIGGFRASGQTLDWALIQGHMYVDNISLTGGARTWPIFGDANLDCRVNILDLIFVRNRLNEDPQTDINWQADVVQDGSINILDMIYVRNRLNMTCE